MPFHFKHALKFDHTAIVNITVQVKPSSCGFRQPILLLKVSNFPYQLPWSLLNRDRGWRWSRRLGVFKYIGGSRRWSICTIKGYPATHGETGDRCWLHLVNLQGPPKSWQHIVTIETRSLRSGLVSASHVTRAVQAVRKESNCISKELMAKNAMNATKNYQKNPITQTLLLTNQLLPLQKPHIHPCPPYHKKERSSTVHQFFCKFIEFSSFFWYFCKKNLC